MFSETQQTIRAIKRVLPAMVGVLESKQLTQLEKELGTNVIQGMPLYTYFQKAGLIDDKGMVKVGGCSGFLVSPQGYILTNRHVVEDKESSYTIIWQQQKFSCEILVRDEITDIAVLKIKNEQQKKFPYLRLGDSSRLVLGQTVIAIGNALGEFQNTVSRGIISGLSRHLKTSPIGGAESQEFYGLIQTDAAINPGNSGGPLIDLRGRVIGINVAVILGVENMGFAIPINQAKKILQDTMKYGRLSRSSLGIRYYLIDEKLQKEHRLPFSYGAFIIYGTTPTQRGVLPQSPAEKAGLTEGDIILEIDGRKVDKSTTLIHLLDECSLDDKIKIKYWHQGKIKETLIKLKES